MQHLLPFLQKLWDKGIDITASVITSVIVAALALAVWKLKLRLDLKAAETKQRQQHRIAEALANEKRQQEAREHNETLVQERENLATAVTRAGNHADLAELWEAYVTWMQARHLQNLLRNVTTIVQYPQWSRGLRAAAPQDFDHNKRTMEQIFRETELPKR